MGLLDKLTKAGSALTGLDGKTPSKYAGVSQLSKRFSYFTIRFRR
jgi:hypothetical protein